MVLPVEPPIEFPGPSFGTFKWATFVPNRPRTMRYLTWLASLPDKQEAARKRTAFLGHDEWEVPPRNRQRRRRRARRL